MGYSLGIDLGTTFTAAAISDGRHAEVVPLGDRSPQAPSVVYRALDGSFRYGEAAERHAAAEPERIAREFKRRMGDRTPIFVAGSPMSAHALSKAYLGWAIGRVIDGQGEPPDRVIVTCPANWGPYRRELMSQVTALNADFPIAVCTEPEAAALHFASARRIAAGQAVAVYDLGGGTFDTALLRRTATGGFEVLGSPDGIEQLGGVDFDEAVFDRVSRGIEWDRLDPEDPDTLAGLARLRRDCTEAKEALSSDTETTVPVLLGGRVGRVRLTRREFEELITPLIEDTVDILERVIRRSGVAPEELAAIVLVGGSSRLPLVGELITRRLGRPAVLSSQPKLCVAMGASLLAAAPELDLVASRTSTATLGVVPGTEAMTTVIDAAPVAPVAPAAPSSPSPAAPTPSDPTPTDPAAGSRIVDDAPTTRIERDRPDPAPRQPTTGSPPRPTRRWAAYPFLAAALAAVALVLMIVNPMAKPPDLAWSDDFHVTAAGRPPGTTLTPTIFGIHLTRKPDPATDGQFDLNANKVFLSGPTRGVVTTPTGASEQVVLKAGTRWSPSRFASVPFAALVLTALFSFAYTESIVRTVRRRHTRATASELVGLVGAGAVAGIAAVLAMWVLGDRLPEVGTALAVVVCVCAAIGLLGFAWPARHDVTRA